MKYFSGYLLFTGIFMLISSNCGAQPSASQYYIDLINSCDYQIVSNVSYNNHSNEKQESLRKEAVLAQLGEKKYIHLYVEKTGEKKQNYYLIKRYNEPQKEYYHYTFSKKPIDVDSIGWDKSTMERWFGPAMVFESYHNEIQGIHDEIFSMLGPITEATGELKRYKVQYKQSGKWQKNGVVYDYYDYDLVEPIAGVLRMCYADGQLKMCIKNQHKQMVKNDGFGDYQFDEAKAVVVEFKQFDNNVNSKRFEIKL